MVQDVRAVKFERSKNVRFSTKTDVFFNRSTLTARTFLTTCATEKLCTSFESPNIQLSGSLYTKGIALQTNLPRSFEGKILSFIQVSVVALFGGLALCPSGSKELNIRALK